MFKAANYPLVGIALRVPGLHSHRPNKDIKPIMSLKEEFTAIASHAAMTSSERSRPCQGAQSGVPRVGSKQERNIAFGHHVDIIAQ